MIPRRSWIAFLLLGFGPLSFAQEAADFFAQKCKMCHTIGGGRRVGPDLKDVNQQKDRAWLENFIQNPKAVIDSGDPFAVQLQQDSRGLVMPTVPGMTPQLAKSLVEFIEKESRESESAEKKPQQESASREPEQEKSAEAKPTGERPREENESETGARARGQRENDSARKQTEAAETSSPESKEAHESASDRPFTADDVGLGTGIFTGARKLSQGGPACISCHTLGTLGGFGGGRLGPDLSGLYDRFGGRDGLGAWLSAPPTPTMQAVFEKRPLQAEEILLLSALFENESQHSRPAGAASQLRFVAASLTGLCGALALVGWIWRQRFRNVRRSLIAAARGVQ